MVFLRELKALSLEQEKIYNFDLDGVKVELFLSWNQFSVAFKILASKIFKSPEIFVLFNPSILCELILHLCIIKHENMQRRM